MDFKNMTDSELAGVMVNYINRVSHLGTVIARYLERSDGGCISTERIRQEYSVLKEELRNDARYLKLKENYEGSELYMRFFNPSVIEAAAFGFSVPSNRAIDQQYYSAVAEARYKLTKHHSLREWEQLM